MDIDFWILNFINSLSIFVVAIIFLKPKLTVKHLTLGLIAIVVQTVVLRLFFVVMTGVFEGDFHLANIVLLLPTLFILYYYSKDLLRSVYGIVLAILIDNIAFLIIYFHVYLFDIDVSSLWMGLFFMALRLFLQLVIALVVKKGFTKFRFFAENRVFMRHFSLIVISLSVLMSLVIPLFPTVHRGAWYLDIIFMVLVIPALIILAFWQLKVFYKREAEAYREQYVSEVEIQQLAIRSFRHDYINLLLTMNQYLKDGDLVGLTCYFNEEIMPTRTLLENQNIELGNLGQLQSKEIKSLLSVKIMEAQSLGIGTVVEIPEVVQHLKMKSSVLARILGVFLDNAIESCKDEVDAMLKVAIIEKVDYQVIVVKNTCGDVMPTAKQMFEKGFSTKDNSRGLGLYNVRQLLDKEVHATLETVISDGYFVQELKIRQED